MRQLPLAVKPAQSVKEYVRERLRGYYLRQDRRARRRRRTHKRMAAGEYDVREEQGTLEFVA